MKPIICAVLFATVYAGNLPRHTIDEEGAGNGYNSNYGGGAGGVTSSGRYESTEGGEFGGQFREGRDNNLKVSKHPKEAISFQSYNQESYGINHNQPKKVVESGDGQKKKNWLSTTLEVGEGKFGGFKNNEDHYNNWENTASEAQDQKVQQHWHKGVYEVTERPEQEEVGQNYVSRVKEELGMGQKKEKEGSFGQTFSLFTSNYGGNEQGIASNGQKEASKGTNTLKTSNNGWSQPEFGTSRPESLLKTQETGPQSFGASTPVWKNPTSGLEGKKKWAQQKGVNSQGQNTDSGAFGSSSRPSYISGGLSHAWRNEEDVPNGQKGSLKGQQSVGNNKESKILVSKWGNQNWNNQENSFEQQETRPIVVKDQTKTWNSQNGVSGPIGGSGLQANGWKNQGNSQDSKGSLGTGLRSSQYNIGSGSTEGDDDSMKYHGGKFVYQNQNSEVHGNQNKVYKPLGVKIEASDDSSNTFVSNQGTNEWKAMMTGIPVREEVKSHNVWNTHKDLETQETKYQGQKGNSGTTVGLNTGWRNQEHGYTYNSGTSGVGNANVMSKGKQNILSNPGGYTTIRGNPSSGLGDKTDTTKVLATPHKVWKNHGGHFQQLRGGSEQQSSSNIKGQVLTEQTGNVKAFGGPMNSWNNGASSSDATKGKNEYAEEPAESSYSWVNEAIGKFTRGNVNSGNINGGGSSLSVQDSKKGWHNSAGALKAAKVKTQEFVGHGVTYQEGTHLNGGLKRPQTPVKNQGSWIKGNAAGSVKTIQSPIKSNGHQGISSQGPMSNVQGHGGSTPDWKHQNGPKPELYHKGSWFDGTTGYAKTNEHENGGSGHGEQNGGSTWQLGSFGGPVKGLENQGTGSEVKPVYVKAKQHPDKIYANAGSKQNGGFGGALSQWGTGTSTGGTTSPVMGMKHQDTRFEGETESLRGSESVSQGYRNNIGTTSNNGQRGSSNGWNNPQGSSQSTQGNPGVQPSLSGWENLEFFANSGPKGVNAVKSGGYSVNTNSAVNNGGHSKGAKQGSGSTESNNGETYSMGNYGWISKGPFIDLPGDEAAVYGGPSTVFSDFNLNSGNYGMNPNGAFNTQGSESVHHPQYSYSMGNYRGNSNSNAASHTQRGEHVMNGGKSNAQPQYSYSMGNNRGNSNSGSNRPMRESGFNGERKPVHTYSFVNYGDNSNGASNMPMSESGVKVNHERKPVNTYSYVNYGENYNSASNIPRSDSGVNDVKSGRKPVNTYSFINYGDNSNGGLNTPSSYSGVNGGKFENYGNFH